MDIFFYEAFEEETLALKKECLPYNLNANYSYKTIQECGHELPAPIISVRTQSIIPKTWKNNLKAILTRSTGFDHISKYLEETKKNIPC